MSAYDKTCFVVMGYRQKTDPATGRVLNLDGTYQAIIKPAVEQAGLTCVRSDEIRQSSVIDVLMYEYLLRSKLVVADLSTYNVNAFYELGVRHALRAKATILMAEQQMTLPFDLKAISTLFYEHLGEDIGYSEALTRQAELRKLIAAVLAADRTDSPVYTFLPLLPPRVQQQVQQQQDESASRSVDGIPMAPGPAPAAEPVVTIAGLTEQARDRKAEKDWAGATRILDEIRERDPGDAWARQQLGLVTYKWADQVLATDRARAKALYETAREHLKALRPAETTDAETLGLWAALHKRLFDFEGGADNLDTAIESYHRGFAIQHDYYNGINYAFMLDVRGAQRSGARAVMDHGLAYDTRMNVIPLCEAHLARLRNADVAPGRERALLEDRYWVTATLEEAYFATAQTDNHIKAATEAEALAQELAQGWMRENTKQQLDTLASLLKNVDVAAFIRADG